MGHIKSFGKQTILFTNLQQKQVRPLHGLQTTSREENQINKVPKKSEKISKEIYSGVLLK